jgi:hypothetical protein
MSEDFKGNSPGLYRIEITDPDGDVVYIGNVGAFISMHMAIEITGGVFLIAGQEDIVDKIYKIARKEIENAERTHGEKLLSGSKDPHRIDP